MWTTVSGNAKQLRDTANQLDAYMESCIALFMKRCTVSEQQLRKMMDAETVLTPDKALEYGLIDRIGTEQKADIDIEQLLKENLELKQQISNKTFQQQELKKFLTGNKLEQKNDPFQAFFDTKRRK